MPKKVSDLEAWDGAKEHTLLAMNKLVRGDMDNTKQVIYHLREAAQLLEE